MATGAFGNGEGAPANGRQAGETWLDERLVSECRSGSAPAWEALIEKYERLVNAIPANFRLPRDVAEDVSQQVWADLHRDMDRLERADSLRAWLFTAAMRRCLACKKGRQKLLQVSGDPDAWPDARPDAIKLHLQEERAREIRDAVNCLSCKCRDLIAMLFFEDPPRPYSEVAQALGMAEGSIGFTRSRCLAKLRAALKPHDL
jgi:RNA polymerase sigma factor (sigma-70 family)